MQLKIVLLATCALTVYAALDAGLGWPLQDLRGPAGSRFVKVIRILSILTSLYAFTLTRAQALLAAQILWGTAIALVKIALLLFYRRIFVTKRFQIADSVMLGITASWFLTFFIVSVITNSFLI